ncbi:hypothetical protein HYR54_13775 [Candidatus Acetothermia bacterium]|nr:hypothetical protein [Candidatus Acetothermia bacterium]
MQQQPGFNSQQWRPVYAVLIGLGAAYLVGAMLGVFIASIAQVLAWVAVFAVSIFIGILCGLWYLEGSFIKGFYRMLAPLFMYRGSKSTDGEVKPRIEFQKSSWKEIGEEAQRYATEEARHQMQQEQAVRHGGLFSNLFHSVREGAKLEARKRELEKETEFKKT